MTPLAAQLRSTATRYRTPLAAPSLVVSTLAGRPALPSPAASTDTETPERARRLTRRRRLEAILLLASEPLPFRRLAQMANLTDGTEARTLLRDLQEAYQQRRSALVVRRIAGGYRLQTRPVLAPWIERFSTPREDETPLTAAAAETLAVVAYRQPVVRAEIESIRGAQSGELLRQLMHRGLLRIVGRSEELGRPILYGTTKQFLQEYGLQNLEELPPVGATPAASA